MDWSMSCCIGWAAGPPFFVSDADLSERGEIGLLHEVRDIIEPSIEAMGYELVRVHHTGGMRPVLQIMVERTDGASMTVDDCAAISRTVSALLDVEDPIAGEYTLEVSSPGIDRPLTRLKDFSRFSGYEARIELAAPVDGRKRFKGRLLGVAGEDVRIAVEDGEYALPFRRIQKAKLVLTDDLVAAHGR